MLFSRSLVGRALLALGSIAATGYFIKAYIDGVILDQTYPLPATNHIEQRFQQVQQSMVVITLMLAFYAFICTIVFLADYRKYQQKLYICQDGLLRLGRKKTEAIRWDEVTDMLGSSDRLLALHRAGQAKFVLSDYRFCNKEISR